MTPDPNWLYSAAAQSAAAIVAIIGGFITSRLLALAAEKRTLEQQLLTLESKIGALRQHKQALLDKDEAIKVDSILFKELGLARFAGAEIPSFDEVKKKHSDSGIRDETLRHKYEIAVQRIRRVRAFMEEKIRMHPADEESFQDWVRKNAVDISNLGEDVLEYTYGEARSEYLRHHPRPFGGAVIGVPGLFNTDRDEANRTAESRMRRDEAREKEIEDVERELLYSKKEQSSLVERIEAFSYPPHLWFGLFVLIYFAIVGIMYPLAQMPADVYDPSSRYLTIGLFVSGLVLLIAYIAYHMLSLRRGPQTTPKK